MSSKRKKHLLMLVHLMPPVGGSSVNRTLGFLRHLGSRGWRVTVICARPTRNYITDESRTGELPPDVRVYRVRSWYPFQLWNLLYKLGLGGLAGWLERLLFVPDSRRLWNIGARAQARQVIAEDRPDAIWSVSLPNSTHLAALALKRRYGIPWLAEFMDEWTPHPFGRPVSPLHRWLHQRAERAVVRAADAVTFTGDEYRDAYRALYPEAASRIHTLEHGYEPDHFAAEPERAAATNQFTVVYTGSFYHGHNPRTFFEGVERFIAEVKPTPPPALVFAGNTGPLPAAGAREAGAEIISTGYVTHARALALCRGADCNLLVVGAARGGGNIPGKSYELLAAGRPVLVVAPAGGALQRITARVAGVVFADADDPEAIARALAGLYESFRSSRADVDLTVARQPLLKQANRAARTEQAAVLLDSICGEAGEGAQTT